jgi:SNF2 family DNA or RNA helicase
VFRPLNTLASPQKPSFHTEIPYAHELGDAITWDKMVQERSSQCLSPQKSHPERQPLANISAKMQSPSPKHRSQPDDDDEDVTAFLGRPPSQPAFGQPSPLRNPLKKKEASLFIPKKPVHKPSPQNRMYQSSAAQQAREMSTGAMDLPPPSNSGFYLPGQRSVAPMPPAPQPYANTGAPFYRPGQNYQHVAPPMNAPRPNIYPPAKPTFTSVGPNTYFQPYQPPKPVADLTKRGDDDDGYDPDEQIRAEGTKFGEPDPYSYVDSNQANENIKNLLEGAFDDDGDKSRTRLRKRARKAAQEGKTKEANTLATKLASLKVEDEKQKAEEDEAADEEEEEEEEEEEDGTVQGMTVKLLPHQVEGVAWMIDKEVGERKRGVLPHGGILADDMGLGKTVQSVALILTNARPALDAKPEHPKQKLPGKEVGKGTLVVAPLALIKQWEHEIKDKVTRSYALKVLVHHGPSRTKSPAELKKYDVVITTYQTLTSEHAGSNMAVQGGNRIGCMGVHWYRIILDEAHSIKNRNAKSTQACYALESWYRWCLTGTPMQNNLDELQSLIKFLRIKPYCELPKWKDAITQPMKAGRGGLAIKRLQVFLRAFMKRRTKDILKKDGALNFGGKAKEGEEAGEKKQGGMQIVKREVLTVECDFDSEERRLYTSLQNRADERLKEMQRNGKGNDYIGALVMLLRLRQACDHYHLVGMAPNKDKDAMTTGANSQKSGAGGDEMDALTALMGGISVESKKCDVCQAQLSSDESRSGASRCNECTADLAMMTKSKKSKGKKDKKSKKEENAARRRKARQLPADSDDEEDEGEWIAKEPEQHINLGKAGGSDDEDAEGGGETLDSIDSVRSDDEDSNEDDSPPRAHIRRRRPAKQEDCNSDASSSSDSESEDDGINEQRLYANHKKHHNPNEQEPSTKIRQLLRILHAESKDHKTIVFSQFTTMLDLIQPHLDSAGIAYVRYDGSMRNDAREASLDSLRNNSATRVLLCSLKCGSLGLNLTAASRVVIVEPFWNPFVEEQAIDRVHRLNQTVDVKVFRLTIRDSVEERILALQERKRELAKAAIEGAGNKVGKLSMQEILSLFKHDGGNGGVHDEEDREMWEKFGKGGGVLDGPKEGSTTSGSGDVSIMGSQGSSSGSRGASGAKPGGQPRYQESDVFGRRW